MQKIDERNFCDFILQQIADITPFDKYKAFLEKNESKIDEVYNKIKEQKSKEIYKKYIFSRLVSDPSIFDSIVSLPQYFIREIFDFDENEVFVDCGAFNGTTTQEFYKFINGKFKFIYSFEPSIINFKMMQDRIANFASDETKGRIKLINKGTYNEVKVVKFDNNYTSNNMTISKDNGFLSAILTRLDDEIDIAPTFIKMDIEGSELATLEGASSIIKKHNPKLAICAYHKYEDVYELPLFVLWLNPNYEILFRHHTNHSYEFVMYCVHKKHNG